ncbi:nitrate reductase molybdenum cofactor assembly chaperone [Aquibaculum arenosum]|uniref:Nitrate reductase molybdenum cofactor assembly chaperone n=1 Tax=Aquibaculum arenosum TaxID=3032591 RepID=A0ABT5YJG0_9PROT|nr:nitrate reductase molybdenum cofactor assembly chaperone [Fodinicurvata sp. CAU 1616]MDF2095075.1 nitrate reductase molybdenum cofactor assembly chaperone [Fodinicurvata sp. CAU 1616]
MLTYRVLSRLLSYPGAKTVAAVGEMRAVLEGEGLVSSSDRKALEPLLADLESKELLDLQERYVLLFDRSRSLSLHLFEHVHGESRDRGQAMVNLGELYAEHGLEVSDRELPDYLPLFLEFLSLLPPRDAAELLAEPAHVVDALHRRLLKRESCYAGVFGTLLSLAAGKADDEALTALLQEPDTDPDDREALDRAWEETAVTFGPDPHAGCPQTRDLLARMAPPPARS